MEDRGRSFPNSVKSITKVLDILEHLGASKRVVSVSDLARATKINVSTAYRLLQTLMARGYVVQETANRGYLLGPRIFQMGSAYLQGNDLASVARPHLEALRDAVHETTYLVIFSQGEIVQLCTADGKQAVSATFRSMVREPAYCTATGQGFALGPRYGGARSIFRAREARGFTPQTVTEQGAVAQGDREGPPDRLRRRRRGIRAESVLRQRAGDESGRQRAGCSDQRRDAEDAIQTHAGPAMVQASAREGVADHSATRLHRTREARAVPDFSFLLAQA